jgi:hypothetical protein
MRDVRWMVILNDRLVSFGVPRMVADAVNRYQLKEAANPALLDRLSRLPPDDNSWTVIAMRSSILAAHLGASTSAPTGAQLKDVDELELGVHYARIARIDFSVHRCGDDSETGSSTAQVIIARLTQSSQSRFRISAGGLISGSISIGEREFDRRLAELRQDILGGDGRQRRQVGP